MDKVILFGGSFNPIHNGHLEVARSASHAIDAHSILFIPVFSHPSKKDLLSYKHRFKMTELATQANSFSSVSPIEKALGSPSFTLHTVEAILAAGFDHEYFLLIGSDSLMDYYKWKGAERIAKLVRIITAKRGDLSSTQIREDIKLGKDASKHLDPKVLKYIKENNLYRL